MAIYHLSAKAIQRSAGKSAVAAAAYRSRSTLHDERQGRTFSYTAASDLVHSEIVGFNGDRATLWNLAESMEKRKDATTAREYEVALPNELPVPDQIELSRSFAEWLNKEHGCVVDYAIHSGSCEENPQRNNPHIHMLTTTRAVDEYGTMADIKIPREWSDKKRLDHKLQPRRTELIKVREQWSFMANAALARAGVNAHIDHRSYADQGRDRLPTSHLGPAVSGMERAGIQTRSGDHNRMVIETNLKRLLELEERHAREISAQKLAEQLTDIDAKIEALRNQCSRTPGTRDTKSGIVKFGHASSDLATRADKEAAKFTRGLALSIGTRYKAKLFRDTWNDDLENSILNTIKWVDVDAKALTLRSGEQVQDKGDTVVLSSGSSDVIAAAIALARSKRWERVTVYGSDDFQLRVALALKEAGIEPLVSNDNARKRFVDEVTKRSKTLLPTPEQRKAAVNPGPIKTNAEPSRDSQPEHRKNPASSSHLDALRSRVRLALREQSPKQTTPFRDDTAALRQWAANQWNSLVKIEGREGLREVFLEEVNTQAAIAGYSAREIQEVVLDDKWAGTQEKLVTTVPKLKPRAASQQRRTDRSTTRHTL
ncbi:MobA/MobL family protein [Marinobacter sp. bablab_jr008]|uniref:MobA/MobL family protein n=1 Tax=Marinobacter sp. bablab_jr008 TaxID=2755064 RepID=UPI0018F13B4A|nr:MobA/MobL family protein [Marinobacter sp. bablab_jr008]